MEVYEPRVHACLFGRVVHECSCARMRLCVYVCVCVFVCVCDCEVAIVYFIFVVMSCRTFGPTLKPGPG